MLANRLRGRNSRVNPLTVGSTVHLLSPYGIQNFPGGPQSDLRFFGYPTFLGGLAPTARNAYTISTSDETIFYASTNGTYVGALVRYVTFTLTGGPIPLAQADITQIVTPAGPTLLTSAATQFVSLSDGGSWQWTVAADPANDAYPTHMGAGDLTVTV